MLYRVNAGALPRDSWIQRDEGGGRIIGEVCHFIDAMTYLCGSSPTETHAVTARDHGDAVSILLRFADGSTGAIVYSSLGDPGVPKEYIEVFANGCVARLDDFARLTINKAGKTRAFKGKQDKGQGALVAAFLDAVAKGGQSPIPTDELAAVTSATLAIVEDLTSL